MIRKDATIVFDDTVEDFYAFAGLKDRFRSWKTRDVDAYKNAFMPVCLPKLFSPIIRLALVFWNPLEVNSSSLKGPETHHSPELVSSKEKET